MSKNRRQNSFPVYCFTIAVDSNDATIFGSTTRKVGSQQITWAQLTFARPCDESFAYWTRTDDERDHVRRCVCLCLAADIESLFLYIWPFYVLYFHASLQSNFIWNILQGIRQAGLPVSEWVTFCSHLIGFCFSSFCLSQLSHYFVTCITPTYSRTA